MSLPRVKIEFLNGALGSVTPSDDGVVGLIAETEGLLLGEGETSKISLITKLKDLKALGIIEKEWNEKEVSGTSFETDHIEYFNKFKTKQEAYDNFNADHSDVRLKEPVTIVVVDNVETSPAKVKIEKLENAKNFHIFNTVRDFYKEAPEGTKLWLMQVPAKTSMKDMFDKDGNFAPKLIEASLGTINLLISKKKEEDDDDVPTGTNIQNSLAKDVHEAMSNAQLLCKDATERLFAPLFVLLEGRNYSGDVITLKNLHSFENNRVGIVIGDTEKDSQGACIGLLAGRVAAIPVQRSIARVKSGPVAADNLFLGKEAAENGNPEAIHDKG